jgi:hypothetical protein
LAQQTINLRFSFLLCTQARAFAVCLVLAPFHGLPPLGSHIHSSGFSISAPAKVWPCQFHRLSHRQWSHQLAHRQQLCHLSHRQWSHPSGCLSGYGFALSGPSTLGFRSRVRSPVGSDLREHAAVLREVTRLAAGFDPQWQLVAIAPQASNQRCGSGCGR